MAHCNCTLTVLKGCDKFVQPSQDLKLRILQRTMIIIPIRALLLSDTLSKSNLTENRETKSPVSD